jgi:hypothetical protein
MRPVANQATVVSEGNDEPSSTHESASVLQLRGTDVNKDWGVVVGTVVAVSEQGAILVQFPDNPVKNPVVARTTVPLLGRDVDRQVVLQFERGNPARPIILGVLLESGLEDRNTSQSWNAGIEADGERLVLTAQRQIVLRCGKASITMTRSGKVLVSGAHIVSRSSGANKIKGGHVEIN